jgi:hypothetical protein
MARYVLGPELKELRKKGVVIQRDTEFSLKEYEQRKAKELADVVAEQMRRAKAESEAQWLKGSKEMTVSPERLCGSAAIATATDTDASC